MKFPILFAKILNRIASTSRISLLVFSTLIICLLGLTALAYLSSVKPGQNHRSETGEKASSENLPPSLNAAEMKRENSDPDHQPVESDKPQSRGKQIARVEKIPSPTAKRGDDAFEPELRTVIPTASPDEPEELEGGGRRRQDWFYFQRAYPANTIPAEAGFRMREQLADEENRLNQSRSLLGLSAAPEQLAVWAALGPAPIENGQTFNFPSSPVSGRVTAIVLDPGYNDTSNKIVYLGTAHGGLWRSNDNGVNWSSLTDNQPSLAVGAVAIDPTNPNVIYVGTGEGNRSGDTYYGQGLLKSTDGGNTWTQILGPTSTTAPNLPSFVNCSFMTIEIDPSNPQTLYAATNVGVIGSASGGVGTVPIGNRGIWKSTDGGLNWRNLNPGNFDVDRSGTDVLIDPQKPQRIFGAILNLGIYRSDQGGEPGSWTLLSGGLPSSSGSPFRRVELAAGPPIAPSSESTLYAAFAASNDDLLGIWRSTDGGNNWTKVTTPQTQGQANYNLELTVDPTNANVVYYGTQANTLNNGGTLFRSVNGGQSWVDMTNIQSGDSDGLHADTHAIAISRANPNILFTGSDGGIWRTDNATAGTVKWIGLNPNLSITQFQSIALHPTNPDFVIGGTQDNGTNLFTGQLNWRQIARGDGGFALIDQSNPQVVYHTFFNQNNEDGQRPQMGPEVSTNGGGSWIRRGCFGCITLQGTFNPADRVSFYAPMALHTGFTGQNGNVVYFGTHRLYRTANRGVTWTGLGASADGFGTDLTKGSGYLTAIAAYPGLANNEEIVWTGASDGTIQITANAGAEAGATFINLTKPPLPNRYVTDLAVDNSSSQRAVVAFSGFNTNTPTTPGHVFLTLNRGQTWQDISGNLPDVPVNSVTLNPANQNTIYIGTDLGVFQTTNGGTSWERLSNGMPRVPVYMVRYQAATNTLFAATHGRGVYRLTTSRSLATVSAASFSGSDIASEAIVAAFGTGLATNTVVANTLPLPTILAGTRVVVRDAAGAERLSPLFFVAPTQVNFLIPGGTVAGTATIIITANDGTVSLGTVQVSTVAPSLFAANSNGREVPAGFALRVTAGGAQINEPISRFDSAQNKFVPTPIDLGAGTDQVFLVLFGTGVRFNSSLSNVTASIGGTNIPVQFAGPQGEFVGLDQINILLSRSLIGRGEVDLVLTADGKSSNTMRINIK